MVNKLFVKLLGLFVAIFMCAASVIGVIIRYFAQGVLIGCAYELLRAFCFHGLPDIR